MKMKFFMISLFAALLFSVNVKAEEGDDGIYCGGQTFIYNDDGTFTIRWDGGYEETYDSLDDYYTEMYGYLPDKNLADTDLMTMFNISLPNNSSQSQSGLNRQRGRLIYTVKEANDIAKEGSINKVRLRYR
ncbi:MAG: hypothetical protein IKS23_01370 [Alphaproteobacteria bacterium]|nr:hypothetical protein [Alphaproteobacteria bacterium]